MSRRIIIKLKEKLYTIFMEEEFKEKVKKIEKLIIEIRKIIN